MSNTDATLHLHIVELMRLESTEELKEALNESLSCLLGMYESHADFHLPNLIKEYFNEY